MISVVDYGVANLGSILNMLRKVGAAAETVGTPEEIMAAEKIILPGVGAFDHGVSTLNSRGLVGALRARALGDRVPILGICLGMQMLGKSSEEGELSGLGLIDARCERFRFDGRGHLKVPHMGWSLLETKRASPLTADLGEKARFYFVHSYHIVCADPSDVLATAFYGIEFVALVQHENVYGAQFHPEKSHRFGMALLSNFARL